MAVHNTRFPEIWAILKNHIDFKNKTLLDIGCGYGDLIKAAHKDGGIVLGIEKDVALVQRLISYQSNNFRVFFRDMNTWEGKRFDEVKNAIDILACFSVLPYLDNPDKSLNNFSQVAETSIIECQYSGDGPGLDWIKDDIDMELWLGKYWNDIAKIGETEVIGRGYRSIWVCK